MVQYLGEYEIDEDDDGQVTRTYNILLEFGEFDLEEFFAQPSHHPPSLNAEIIEFWNSLGNVAKALQRIHNLSIVRENGHVDEFHG